MNLSELEASFIPKSANWGMASRALAESISKPQIRLAFE
jgi:hypothetical protein